MSRKPDERVRRTHEKLGSAMVGLIQEKPIADVKLQDVLERAAVGRSTFYLHFRDKDDLLVSQFEKFLEMVSTVLTVRQEESLRVAAVAGTVCAYWRAEKAASRAGGFRVS